MFIIMAAFFFALMSFFIRLSGDLPTMQKSFFRNAVASVAAAAMLGRSKEKFRVRKGSLPWLLIRSAAGTVGLIANYYAIDHMNISDANMLNKLSPFFAIIASIFVLKEKVSKTEWVAVFIAFGGALLVMKPSFSAEAVPAFIGVLGGLTAGIAYTFVRFLGIKGERGPVIVLFFSVFSTLVCLPFLVLDFHPMSASQFLCLITAGVAAMGGQLSITAAYTAAPAKEISVFDYSQILFAALLGIFFLGQYPDLLSLLGYAVIIWAAVWKWKYGRRHPEG